MTKEQGNMKDLVIPGEVLEKAEISGSDFRIVKSLRKDGFEIEAIVELEPVLTTMMY